MKKSPDAFHSNQDEKTGSPTSGEPVFLAAGQLRRTHGLAGELVMTILTDFPQRIKKGQEVFIGEKHLPLEIASVRWQNKDLLICFVGYDTSELASRIKNNVLFIKADGLPELPKGEYYHHQLIGLTVVNDEGKTLGVLSEILETGANDVYVVKTEDGEEVLLPALNDVILEIDLSAKKMRVKPPTWS